MISVADHLQDRKSIRIPSRGTKFTSERCGILTSRLENRPYRGFAGPIVIVDSRFCRFWVTIDIASLHGLKFYICIQLFHEITTVASLKTTDSLDWSSDRGSSYPHPEYDLLDSRRRSRLRTALKSSLGIFHSETAIGSTVHPNKILD